MKKRIKIKAKKKKMGNERERERGGVIRTKIKENLKEKREWKKKERGK